MYINGVHVSGVYIQPIHNGWFVRIGLKKDVYAPSLRAALRHAVEELAKAEPEAGISDDELGADRAAEEEAPMRRNLQVTAEEAGPTGGGGR